MEIPLGRWGEKYFEGGRGAGEDQRERKLKDDLLRDSRRAASEVGEEKAV